MSEARPRRRLSLDISSLLALSGRQSRTSCRGAERIPHLSGMFVNTFTSLDAAVSTLARGILRATRGAGFIGVTQISSGNQIADAGVTARWLSLLPEYLFRRLARPANANLEVRHACRCFCSRFN